MGPHAVDGGIRPDVRLTTLPDGRRCAGAALPGGAASGTAEDPRRIHPVPGGVPNRHLVPSGWSDHVIRGGEVTGGTVRECVPSDRAIMAPGTAVPHMEYARDNGTR